MEKDEAKKKELLAVFLKETLTPALVNFEKVAANSGGDFFFGGEVTWGDLVFAATMEACEKLMGTEWRAEAPKVAAVCEKVRELPNIKKWIETRPVTEN